MVRIFWPAINIDKYRHDYSYTMARRTAFFSAMSMTMIILSCAVSGVNSVYYIDKEINVIYSVSGVYNVNADEVRVLSETLSVNITSTGVVTFNYYMDDLPYGMAKSYMILSSSDMATLVKNDIYWLWDAGKETDPTKPWYGVDIWMGIFRNSDVHITFMWDKHSGILFDIEMQKLHEMQRVLHITYESSTFDIYQYYSKTYVDMVSIVKFIVTPVGIVVVVSPIIFFTIMFFYIAKMRQKTKERMKRNGRFIQR